MAGVSARSEKCLRSVDTELGDVVRRALQAAPAWLDFAVVSGLRTTEEQQALFRKGRDVNGTITDRRKIVTWKDGVIKKSRHQSGKAVDIVAYVDGVIDWSEKPNLAVAAYVIGFAAAHGVKLVGGVKWKWDYGHVELETS
ncbi:MAG: M15 family metallopeptidase [bacterium]|nr:M15 family metallopeptidase [bacterium]